MEEEKQKNAIDTIYDILLEIKELKKQLIIVDNNVKLLNNKLSKSNKMPSDADSMAPRAEVPVKSLEPAVIQKPNPKESIKVFGRIKNHNKEPISKVDVKIYNEAGEMIKKRNTDEKGYWEARISPGKYGVEYDPTTINKKLKPLNIKINVVDGMKEFEVK